MGQVLLLCVLVLVVLPFIVIKLVRRPPQD